MGINELLATQGGVITRTQALGAGLSAPTVTRRLSTKEWHRTFPGVYRHAAAPVTDRLMLESAWLWLGPAASISGSWAAWWHELRHEPEGPVCVTIPRARRVVDHPHIEIRRRDLDISDVVMLRGVQVTSRALTALENARLPDGDDVLDRALQRRLPLPELSGAMDRLFRAHGAVAARSAVEARADGTVSPPERQLAAALRKECLAQVKAGITVRVNGRPFWLDFAVEDLQIAVEVDGFAPHSDPGVFRRDRERQNALVLGGWTVLRFTPWQIRCELPKVIASIRAAIGDAQRSVETSAHM